MTLEHWIKWQPIDNLSSKYYVDSISDSIEGFMIVMSDSSDENNKIKVIFKDSVHAYRSTDESFRQSTINNLDKIYGTQFYTEWMFFKLTNSEYLHWLSQQSYKIADSEPLIHFSFLAEDSIVDVIAAYEPRVEFID